MLFDTRQRLIAAIIVMVRLRYFVFICTALALNLGAARAQSDALTLISETWTRYRSVKTEREESEILIVSGPQAAGYSRAETEALVREARSGVIHKRAVRHVLYAPDRHDKIHLLFSLPADDAGLGLLVWRQTDNAQDDMWLFMPGYRAVRRIPVSSQQRLAGTNLLYEDVRELAGERTDRYTYKLLAGEQLDGRAADVVVATPKPGTESAYSSRKIWVDKEWLFPLKVEFSDAAGKLWKVMRNTEIREVAPGARRADLAEMRDLQANECTLLLITKRSVGRDIPAQVFTEDYLVHPGAD
ncbi:MAG: outer membrane lipoprotein-sorting protein [Deltaproteobacteria bacterium]|nr:outer membrane lipoprotein-sorting protein [Deltaproteobacteria bacterium]